MRMIARIVVVPVVLALAGCAPAATQPPIETPREPGEPTALLAIRGTSLVIERPDAWWKGGFLGGAALHSFIGARHGYPSFSVDWDPDSLTAGQNVTSTADRIEELHELLTPDHVVEYAEWVVINALEVYSTALTFESVAGLIRVRRLLLAYDDRP